MKLRWSAGRAGVDGVRLAWEQAGPGRGEPLLLVMGLGGQLIHWPDALCGELVGRGFRVIRFDNRDAGLSDDSDRGIGVNLPRTFLGSRLGLRLPANYSLHDLAADAVGLLDALGIGRAHLAGVSMGGMIGQILASRFPKRVCSLTSIMSSTNDPRLPPARLDVLWRMSGIGGRPRTREAVIRRSTRMLQRIGSPAFPTPVEYRRHLAGRAYDRAFRPAGTMRQMQAILSTGSLEGLVSQIRVPTQVVHGLSDPLLRPACGKRSARLIRGSRLELIPGMGHDMPPTLMPRWAELIAGNAARA
ncbi:MAG: alpha/beta fold hydrolase [Gammaproteobacteria bacterium]|nr:alpha/beta fold hydrolase [Gammaproteobacteria bacterium]